MTVENPEKKRWFVKTKIVKNTGNKGENYNYYYFWTDDSINLITIAIFGSWLNFYQKFHSKCYHQYSHFFKNYSIFLIFPLAESISFISSSVSSMPVKKLIRRFNLFFQIILLFLKKENFQNIYHTWNLGFFHQW